jgi:hypothetical protein
MAGLKHRHASINNVDVDVGHQCQGSQVRSCQSEPERRQHHCPMHKAKEIGRTPKAESGSAPATDELCGPASSNN